MMVLQPPMLVTFEGEISAPLLRRASAPQSKPSVTSKWLQKLPHPMKKYAWEPKRWPHQSPTCLRTVISNTQAPLPCN
jgi:hypothetical protein